MIKIERAEFIKSAKLPSEYPAGALPEFAFFGRSNCGKSSLINMLVNRKGLVKAGATPGMTRLVNFFAANGSFILADLPGYGFARRSAAEKKDFDKMLEAYVSSRSTLKAIFFLMDSRRPPDKPEEDSIGYFLSLGRDVVPVATKADKLNSAEKAASLKRFSSFFESLDVRSRSASLPLAGSLDAGGTLAGAIFASALKKTGREELLKEIEARL